MKKVLLINRNGYDAKDGATRSLKQLSESLPSYGYDVRTLNLNVRWREVPALYYKLTLYVLKSDFVIINSLASGLELSIRWIVFITRFFRKKTFLYVRENQIHYTDIYENKITPKQKESLKTLCNSKHIRLWFVSKYAQRAFEKYIQRKEDTSKVVYNGVELDTRALKPKSDEMKIVSCIGSLQSLKGYDYFLDVAELMLNNYSNLEFRWYGNGPDKIVFENLVRDKGIQNSCKLIDYTPLSQILSESDGIMVCSKAESFSRVAIEALIAEKKLFVRSGVEATLEITEGACMELDDNIKKINAEAFMLYLSEKQDMKRISSVIEKYSMPNHCKRIIEALES